MLKKNYQCLGLNLKDNKRNFLKNYKLTFYASIATDAIVVKKDISLNFDMSD